MRHERVDWDERKAKSNLSKHAVTFESAAEALADLDAERFHKTTYDSEHSEVEDRWTTFCSDPFRRLLVLRVTWTSRTDRFGAFTWIISARKATQFEYRDYWRKVMR